MILFVDTGKKEPLRYSNGSVSVSGSNGITHTGIIDLREGIKSAINKDDVNKGVSKVIASNNTVIKEESIVKNIPKSSKKEENTLIDRSSSSMLKSGQKLSLDSLVKSNKIVISLKYEFKNSGFDVDTSLFLTDANGKTSEENFIYYNNLNSKDGSVKLDNDFGKNFTKYYNNVIAIDLSKVDSRIDKISITSTIDEGNKNFSELVNSKLFIIDVNNNKEAASFNYDENLTTENAIVIIEIYKHNGNWKIQSIGKGFNGGLEALCNNYGVETE